MYIMMKKASAKDISDAINKIFQEKNQELLKKIKIHENKLLKKVSPNEISELFRECFNENTQIRLQNRKHNYGLTGSGMRDAG